jgi:hypothetical protein
MRPAAMPLALHSAIAIFLTLLTQLGGLAWVISRATRWPLTSFVALYVLFSSAAVVLAPMAGRVALSCTNDGALQMHSIFYCALNRHYVTPELYDVLADFADTVEDTHAGTVTQVLDAGFPFVKGMPLLPHLSHDDGEKADIALFYQNNGTYLPARTRSPLGYFAFEEGHSPCEQRWASLRWDMAWLQKIWPDWSIDTARTQTALRVLHADSRVGKVFIEPHLAQRVGVTGGKIRFQGCRAARHDDHIHIQL